jgi:hypothetical protein
VAVELPLLRFENPLVNGRLSHGQCVAARHVPPTPAR